MEVPHAGSRARMARGDTDMPQEALRPSTSYRHGIQQAMAALNGQWVVAVLASLADRPLTYTDLLSDINSAEERLNWISHPRPVSQKVLSSTLKRMRRDGLITRSGPQSAFGEVWSEISPLGRTLLPALRPLEVGDGQR